ncbi:MAG: hypothetical protein J6Y40_01575 [Bacteroidales bacterium]|nr:hypothetical protein [Bacteroidales bacterium]
MKNLILTIIAIFCFSLSARAQQVDSIFFINGKVIGCNITKVSSGEVEFTFVGEDLLNVESKSSISKIKLKNGREQVFNDVKSVVKGHGEFWGIKLGTDIKYFLKELQDESRGARIIERQDNDEVKLVAEYKPFKSADIYVHFNEKGLVTHVDVQQNQRKEGRDKRKEILQEMRDLIDELNSKYELVDEGAKPWNWAIYKWEWKGDNLRIVLSRATGYSRPRLVFYDLGADF